jgi:hypothetical protein
MGKLYCPSCSIEWFIGGLIIKLRTILISVIAIVIIVSAFSGCIGGNSNPTPTTAGSSTTPGASKAATGANAVVNAVQSGNTITISGTKTDQDKDQLSTAFTLEKGTYIYSWDNKGSLGDIFTATIDAVDGSYSYPIVLWDAKGTSFMSIEDDGLMIKPGQAKLTVANGGTYTVTITKPTSGASLPQTITLAKGEQMAKAVMLNPGEVKISVKHTEYSKDKIGTTTISLHKADTGKYISLDSGGWVTSEANDLTGTVDEAGVYVLGISLSAYTGGEVTISQ